MKRIKIALILIFLAAAFYVNAQERHSPGNGYNNGKGHYSHGNGNGNGHTGPGVGAPLDGGLLLVIAGAGVAYYSARKKGKNPES